jgi:threonine dehydrogenase-like Zn-dependent dehydrogenase
MAQVADEARAFWVTAPGHGEIRTEVLPEASGEEAVVRTLYSGISRGTESLVFRGQVPPTEWHRMRAPFQSGDFPAPVKYGYCSVGVVERGPSALTGQTVFVLYPHQTRFVVPADAVHVLPAGVPAARAVLAANLETAINASWDATPHLGDRIAVVGAGTVGCLIAWLLSRIPGCSVQLIDVNAQRAEVAKALSIPFRSPSDATGDCDLVVHASGAPAGLQSALTLAAFEATVLEASWYGNRDVTLPLGQAFHAQRLILKSSQVGHVAPAQRARWSHARRMQLALSLLTDPTLDALITGESEFDSLPATMAALAESGGNTLCHRVRYS